MKGRRGPGAGRAPGPLRTAGAGLPEMLAVLALIGLGAAWAAPAAAGHWRRMALRAAAADLVGQLRRLRHEAASRGRVLALAFERRGGGWALRRFADGNGNGVRASEIESGIDPPDGGSLDLRSRWGRVRPGLPPYAVPRVPPARGVLLPGADPLQLSGTDRVSCAPGGSCTPGSVYLIAEGEEAAAVVLYGGTGRVRAWRFAPREARWIRY